MTLEITDRTEFANKFAFLMAANMDLINSGFPPSAELAEQMVNEFLNQFIVATPMPAKPNVAGYIVVNNMSGYIPIDFLGLLYTTEVLAEQALIRWFNSHREGQISAYSIREATYFG